MGPAGVALNSSFNSRDTPQYKEDLGNAVVNYARVVPDGLLVFFPSYVVLRQCIEYWKSSIANGARLAVSAKALAP